MLLYNFRILRFQGKYYTFGVLINFNVTSKFKRTSVAWKIGSRGKLTESDYLSTGT
jgi:hypothetical protein